MSTYEEEHNLNASEGNNDQNANNGVRRVPTLQQALNEFMTTSATSATPLTNRSLAERMLGEIVGSTGGNVDELFTEMINSIDEYANDKKEGVDQSFLDGLERVNVKKLKPDAVCPICTNEYHSDPHPLVVELPCNSKHRFDLDCIGPWLKFHKTCPLCRKDVTKKEREVIVDSEEEEDDWEMYG